MIESVQEQLLGHLLGALDDSQHESIHARLEHDPEFRRQLSVVGRMLEPLESARRDFTPPSGLAERTCRLVASYRLQ